MILTIVIIFWKGQQNINSNIFVPQILIKQDDRVRDCRGATQGAVRSGAQHRSECVAPQSPTRTAHNCKK